MIQKSRHSKSLNTKTMKRLFICLTTLVIFSGAFAQSPEKTSYQAVVRNSSNQLVTNHEVGMKISILQGSLTGTAIYEETQTTTSNANGLVTLEIGEGDIISGTFSTIDWANGPFFIKVESDPTGETNYAIEGTSQLLSVPYALYAKMADSITGKISETDPVFDTSIAAGITSTDTTIWNNKLDSFTETQNLADVIAINNSANSQIKNITNPTDAQDAATKAYVDALKESIYNELLDAGLNGIVKDIEGNTYKTIKIGTQVWMAENLRVTKLNDGKAIQQITSIGSWPYDSTRCYCWYNNEIKYKNTYGALYNWHILDTGNICPEGWHVPKDTEWTILTDFLGGDVVAGGKMKEADTTHWLNPNIDATNESGFTALPG